MSLFPLDLTRYKEWTIEQLYYSLFPYIKEDFMGRQDCSAVHTEGNMTVTTASGPANVIHIVRGGSDSFLQAKEAEYRAYVEEGKLRVRAAQETGVFVG